MDVSKLILYEDNHLIVVNKPSGILAQSDNTGDKNMGEYVAEFIQQRDNKPGKAFVGLVHRIDRPVSGILILAKTSKALSRMNDLFRLDNVNKTYLALVNGTPQLKEQKLIHYLRKNSKSKKADVFNKPVENGKLSELTFKVISVNKQQALLEVNPISGRFHQIRAQLAKIGLPIVGDIKYGAPQALKDKSICLHAYKIAFLHPVKNIQMEIQANDYNFPLKI